MGTPNTDPPSIASILARLDAASSIAQQPVGLAYPQMHLAPSSIEQVRQTLLGQMHTTQAGAMQPGAYQRQNGMDQLHPSVQPLDTASVLTHLSRLDSSTLQSLQHQLQSLHQQQQQPTKDERFQQTLYDVGQQANNRANVSANVNGAGRGAAQDNNRGAVNNQLHKHWDTNGPFQTTRYGQTQHTPVFSQQTSLGETLNASREANLLANIGETQLQASQQLALLAKTQQSLELLSQHQQQQPYATALAPNTVPRPPRFASLSQPPPYHTHAALIAKLWQMQTSFETKRLASRALLEAKHADRRKALDAGEITRQTSERSAREAEWEMEREMNAFDVEMFRGLEGVREKQQAALRDAGMAGFKVTADPREIAAQVWCLSPFILIGYEGLSGDDDGNDKHGGNQSNNDSGAKNTGSGGVSYNESKEKSNGDGYTGNGERHVVKKRKHDALESIQQQGESTNGYKPYHKA